ncbi:MAG: VWA domain-containing protein [Armatimonadota bacterium]|nr:VWA domain-containing protein [Armatimonadota bacterium]
MSSSLNVRVALSHPSVPASTYMEGPLYAVLDLTPTSASSAGDARPPLNIVIVVDASASMHHFQLTDEEREYWLGLAISRDEMERGQADESDAIYWTGQTLAEMQTTARTPMALAVEAIKNLLVTLQPTDHVAVVAFADRVHTVFSVNDWATFPDNCLQQMDLLREQRLPVDIGTGTYMAESLRQAADYLQQNTLGSGISRLILISDGIVQDPDATLANITTIQSNGFAIATIGVGDDFDEEFLTQVADNSRGEYRYAADIAEITDCLHQEMTTLEAISVTDCYIAVRGLDGTVIQELYQIRPSMSLFDEVFTEGEWLRARIGDVSGAAPSAVLVQLAPPLLPPGRHDIAEVQLTWFDTGARTNAGTESVMLPVTTTDDATEYSQTDPNVTDLVDRFNVYKYEREAQRAAERGDLERAREKLGAATRQLHQIGEEALAADMEQQIASLGQSGADPTRAKRIKATTRRLGSTPPG